MEHLLHMEELNRSWPLALTPEVGPHCASEVHDVTYRNQPSFPLPAMEVARNLPAGGGNDSSQEVLLLSTGTNTAIGDDTRDVE